MTGHNGAVKNGLLLLGLFSAVSVFILPLGNPDFFWHLSAGKFIAQNLKFPTMDFLSWSKAGQPWTDFEWLTQLIYYLIYNSGGYWAVFALKVFLACAGLFIFFLTLKLYKAENLFFIAAPLWACAMFPNIDIRPEQFTFVFFLAELFLLEKMRLGMVDAGNKKIFAFAVLFFAAWSNFHAGFIFGLALLFFYFCGELLSLGIKPSAKIAIAGAGAFLGTLINPYGWKVYIVALEHNADMDILRENILEWQRSDIANFNQLPYWLLMAAAFTLLIWNIIKKRNFSLAHVFSLSFFALQSAEHIRHTMFFTAVSAPYIFCQINHIKARRSFAFALAAAVFALSLGYMKIIAWPRIKDAPWGYSSRAEGPCRFLEHNKRALAGTRMYNPWGWGGYLGWRLWPDYKVFQDGRHIFHEFIPPAVASRKSPEKWKNFLDKYDFNLLLMDRNFRLVPSKVKLKNGKSVVLRRPMYVFLMPREDWAIVFWDYKSIVFAKRKAFAKKWIKENEYKFLRPDDAMATEQMLNEGYCSGKDLLAEQEKFYKGLALSAAPL
ncbi:MAG: hypothetical protein NTW04_02170 [Elusimicrobia bacterium]|nr:hypothetical protein [Elusimicrobiota bacterium]